MVEDGDGSVILVGGQTQDIHFLDSLFQLSLASGNSDWCTFRESPFQKILNPDFDSYGQNS
jgi:hypothetical protein